MKRLSQAIVTCALTFTLVAPARGAVGTSFGAAPAVVIGAASMGLAVGGVYGGYRLIKRGKIVIGTAAIVASIAVGAFGFMLLDGGQEARFAELSAEGAEELGLSELDREIYNSEVEQVNAVAREIGAELLRQKSQDPELARDLWIDLGTTLSPETMKTVIAIAQQH